ncbi:MAG: methyltransferase domain-containing protein [Verrucomicrobiaceae bacterium]|nr:methyltransferase domain-containing protein [Verrucomicrobiaceae bacterium]
MLQFRTALIWSALSGFLALAWEIVWSRLFNFASASRAEAFGVMLGSYLLGLALGSLWSRRWHDAAGGPSGTGVADAQRRTVARWIMAANGTAFLVAPLTSWAVIKVSWLWALPMVMISGGLLGLVFPLVCHWAIPPDARSGQRLSQLYVANIVGSGFGSLFTGFGLMEWLGIAAISVMLLAAAWGWAETVASWRMPAGWRVAGLALAAGAPAFFAGFYERLQYKSGYQPGMRFEKVFESRHGVITVDTSHAVYGNGAYDGVISTSLARQPWLVRPYLIPALHETPEDVLMIGVSSGAWTRIVASHPQVKRVTAVEISRACLDVVRAYSEVSSIVADPKIEMVIDDGRRWMRRHAERKFDVIVANTSMHWREFATAVLSKEFLEMTRAHLKPGGIVMWNCTGSGRAARTGMEVFPHTMMAINNCIGSLSPLRLDKERWRRVLEAYRIDGTPVFDLASEPGRGALAHTLTFADRCGDQPDGDEWRWLNREQMQARWTDERIITDDNLGHEYVSRSR